MSIVAHHRFSTHDYHRMAETGILTSEDRVELLNGEIVEMSPIGRRHASVVTRLTLMFADALKGRAIPWGQNPIQLDDLSEPQPDVSLLRPRADIYSESLPRPDEVLLLIEVADSSGVKDREIKLPMYARAGIAEVWIVDLIDSTVTVHREPVGENYRQVRRAAGNESISPAAFADVVVNVGELLK
jgi:Uma2 family endonuclease